MNEALKNLAIKMDEISKKKKLSMVFIDSIEEFFTVTLHDLIQIEMNGHLSTLDKIGHSIHHQDSEEWDMKIGNDKGIIGLMRIINDYEYNNQ